MEKYIEKRLLNAQAAQAHVACRPPPNRHNSRSVSHMQTHTIVDIKEPKSD